LLTEGNILIRQNDPALFNFYFFLLYIIFVSSGYFYIVGTIVGSWKNKDYSTVSMDELLVITQKASSEQARRSRQFEVTLNNFNVGHSHWALQKLNAAKGLLADTVYDYSDMLNAIKLRADVLADATMRDSTATCLRENEGLGTDSHKRWFQAREAAKRQMEAANPRVQRQRGVRETEEGEDDDEEIEVDIRRRTLKLSSSDRLKQAPANKQFKQVEMDHFLEHAKVWGIACNIVYQPADLQWILFEGIISTSFRSVLILKHKARVTEEGVFVPEMSKIFKECPNEAAHAIGLSQDDFVRRSSFFRMKKMDGESQSVYLRRCKEA
jgi:hypothetical protein